jgi:MFS family permease
VLADRLGLPKIGTARPFVVAMLLDALGSGLFLPFSVLYFHRAGGLPLTDAGLGLSIAMLAALPAPLVAGSLVDRSGPKRIVVATNVTRAFGFLSYLAVHSLPALVAAGFLIAVSDRLFWAAQPVLVAEIAGPGRRDRWFGLITAVRCTGLGLGGLLAGAAISRAGVTGYHLLTVANALSFACCAGLLARLRIPPRPPTATAGPRAARRGDFLAAVADRPFCGVVLSNLAFGIARTAILVGLPVYAVQVLNMPPWLAGALYAEYTALIAIGQTTMVRRLERFRRTRALMLAAWIWAASFMLLAAAPLLPHPVVGPFVAVVTGLYTAAVMLHVGVIDALVVEAAPNAMRGRYIAVYQLSWAIANAVAPGLFTLLLAWRSFAPWIALTLLAMLALGTMLLVEPRLSPQAVRIAQLHQDAESG